MNIIKPTKEEWVKWAQEVTATNNIKIEYLDCNEIPYEKLNLPDPRSSEMSYELQDAPHLPCLLTDDPTFVYYNSSNTDVTRTWRKYGWKPASELKENQNENNV
jgi:hypothetical protein